MFISVGCSRRSSGYLNTFCFVLHASFFFLSFQQVSLSLTMVRVTREQAVYLLLIRPEEQDAKWYYANSKSISTGKSTLYLFYHQSLDHCQLNSWFCNNNLPSYTPSWKRLPRLLLQCSQPMTLPDLDSGGLEQLRTFVISSRLSIYQNREATSKALSLKVLDIYEHM